MQKNLVVKNLPNNDEKNATKKPFFIKRAFVYGSPTWARTRDTWINSPLLYRLSYWRIKR